MDELNSGDPESMAHVIKRYVQRVIVTFDPTDPPRPKHQRRCDLEIIATIPKAESGPDQSLNSRTVCTSLEVPVKKPGTEWFRGFFLLPERLRAGICGLFYSEIPPGPDFTAILSASDTVCTIRCYAVSVRLDESARDQGYGLRAPPRIKRQKRRGE